MKMNNNQGGINTKFNYLLLAFFMLVGFQSAFSQKYEYKDYIIESLANTKVTGKISLNKKFWHSTIYLENKDLGIYDYYYPHQLKGFVKGDSVFIVIRVNYKKFKENGISKRNFALLLNDNGVVKLYKSYIPMENGIAKEIFFYSKQGTKDDPLLIEDNKSSVLSVVSDCKRLKNDITQYGYEYSESYFTKLFENYYQWSKDSTALWNLSEKSIVKWDAGSSSDTSSILPSATISETADSMSLDSTDISSLLKATETTIVKADSIAAPTVSETTIVKPDSISSSETSTVVKDNQDSPEPLIDGFASGDSILFEYNGFYYPGQFLNHTKSGKCSIKYLGMGEKLKTQNVSLQTVYKTIPHPENKDYFGYEVGESANIEVFVTKLNTKVLKPCTITGLSQNRLVINYLTEDGKERVLSVDKGLIK